MFKNVFQGGPCVEVFSSQGKEPLAKWKIMGASSIHKVFEKEVKSYVHVLEGANTTTKIQLPKDPKQTMVLIQRYLILQLLVPHGKDFSIELSVSDMSNNKRRVLFSTAQRDISATPLHAKIPLTILKRAAWLNLCIDMVSIVGEAFRGQTYKSLDTLTISAACHLRKVFTMKSQLSDDTDDDDLYEVKPFTNDNELDSLPRSMQFANDVSYQTQVLNMNKLKHAELKLRGENSRPPSSTETDLNSSMRAKQESGKPMHIAFGSKVPVPSTASGKRIPSSTGAREDSSSAGSRTSRSTHSRTQRNEDSLPSARGNLSARGEPDTLVVHGHLRQKSDPGTELLSDPELDKGTLSGSKTWSPGTGGISEEIKPHPPRQKSGDKSRRSIKVRPSSGKERKDNSQPNSRSNSGSTKRGNYDRMRYSSTQDQLASEESSDVDAIQNGRQSDAVILKSAAARIRVDSLSEDEKPVFEESGASATSEKLSHINSARTKRESYSESDDVLQQSAGRNVVSSGRGKVQRRKKKPERGRMDSLSETEEVQTIRSSRTVNGRDGRNGSKSGSAGNSRGSGKGDGRVNGAKMSRGDAKKSNSDSRISDRLHSNRHHNNPVVDATQKEEDEDEEDEESIDDNPHPQHQGNMYTFMSPPRNAPVRMVERSRQLDPKKLQIQLEKISLASQDPDSARSSENMEMPSNDRGAELEADFLEADFLQGNVSAEEEPLDDRDEKLWKSKERYQAIVGRTPSPRLTARSPYPGERSPVPPMGQRSPIPHRRGQRSPIPRGQKSNENNDRDSASSPAIINEGPAPVRGSSPTLRRSKLKGSKLSADDAKGSPKNSHLLMSSPRAMSRCSVSSKRLKEIAKDDPRLSISDDYDWRKYQSNNSSLASSMEANMLASLHRQQLEEMLDDEPVHETNNSFDIHNYGDDDLSSSSSDDTVATFGTFKQPESSKKSQRYQDEMHFPANGNPLLQSNPRDWGEPFSPPIILPSERIRDDGDSKGMFLDQQSPNKDGTGLSDFGRYKSSSSEDHTRHTESDDGHEDELDLLYDPCLNCYFDPKTGKYYELK